jgi:hypothetical protein
MCCRLGERRRNNDCHSEQDIRPVFAHDNLKASAAPGIEPLQHLLRRRFMRAGSNGKWARTDS